MSTSGQLWYVAIFRNSSFTGSRTQICSIFRIRTGYGTVKTVQVFCGYGMLPQFTGNRTVNENLHIYLLTMQLRASRSQRNFEQPMFFVWLWLGVAFAARRLNACQTEIKWQNANWRSSTQLRKSYTDRCVAVCSVVWVFACRWNSDHSPLSIDIFRSSRVFVTAAVTSSSYSFTHRTGSQW